MGRSPIHDLNQAKPAEPTRLISLYMYQKSKGEWTGLNYSKPCIFVTYKNILTLHICNWVSAAALHSNHKYTTVNWLQLQENKKEICWYLPPLRILRLKFLLELFSGGLFCCKDNVIKKSPLWKLFRNQRLICLKLLCSFILFIQETQYNTLLPSSN